MIRELIIYLSDIVFMHWFELVICLVDYFILKAKLKKLSIEYNINKIECE